MIFLVLLGYLVDEVVVLAVAAGDAYQVEPALALEEELTVTLIHKE